MKGILYGVGVGPGDPELITMKAVRLIRACDVIAVPHKEKERCFALRIASAAVPEIEAKPILEIDMPMTRDRDLRERAYAEGASLLIRELDAGKTVVFLTLGDPMVYSTYGYLHARVCAKGYDAQLVPGVTSFCAASAALGETLCADREALHILPGGASAEEALHLSGTKVFMKGELSALKAAIAKRDLCVRAVENCGTPQQTVYADASALPDDASYYTVLIAKEKQA